MTKYPALHLVCWLLGVAVILQLLYKWAHSFQTWAQSINSRRLKYSNKLPQRLLIVCCIFHSISNFCRRHCDSHKAEISSERVAARTNAHHTLNLPEMAVITAPFITQTDLARYQLWDVSGQRRSLRRTRFVRTGLETGQTCVSAAANTRVHTLALSILASFAPVCTPHYICACVCAQSIDRALSPLGWRWGNRWSCWALSEPPDLCQLDWQSGERIRKQI